mmetsp:Transcript_35252/g.94378  ORF Transcript_35252/g.94378 Transcript_35252/m.94378 type:complete len:127 (+) Transcript_35252:647-1027(+)
MGHQYLPIVGGEPVVTSLLTFEAASPMDVDGELRGPLERTRRHVPSRYTADWSEHASNTTRAAVLGTIAQARQELLPGGSGLCEASFDLCFEERRMSKSGDGSRPSRLLAGKKPFSADFDTGNRGW